MQRRGGFAADLFVVGVADVSLFAHAQRLAGLRHRLVALGVFAALLARVARVLRVVVGALQDHAARVVGRGLFDALLVLAEAAPEEGHAAPLLAHGRLARLANAPLLAAAALDVGDFLAAGNFLA